MEYFSKLPDTYLGDGLYAAFDGYQVRLYTSTGDAVYLEPEVLDNFLKYIGERK